MLAVAYDFTKLGRFNRPLTLMRLWRWMKGA